MNGMQDLRTSLLDLLQRLQGTEVNLIIGGGFGIYLKAEFVRRNQVRTLLQPMPEARSTNDLDLFLRPELLIASAKLKPLAEALKDLGYQPVPGAENYQFVKSGLEGRQAGGVKIDLLTGPRSRFEGTYTFLIMKLFAFRDRFIDPSKDYARYHVLDLYTILATTAEDEWRSALKLREQYKGHPLVGEAGGMVSQYFSDSNARGVIRLRESPYFRSELQTEKFLSALMELFPVKP